MGNEPSSEEPQKHEAKIDAPIDGVRYTVVFESDHFAEGSCRLAFRGVYRGRGPKDGARCVTKISNERFDRSVNDYEADLRASRTAEEFAASFNQDYVSSKPLHFVLPEIATVTKVGRQNDLVRQGDKILVEDFIAGSYEKFNNNTSYHSDEVATVPCFSHYTYYKSGGRLLVCDIQGVRTRSGYILTDPAVHSRTDDGYYGDTDLGRDGMVKFFSSHRCTSVCVKFPISDFRRGQDLPERNMEVTQKNYCNGRLNGPPCECCDGRCGPRNGCNCLDCMLKDIDSFGIGDHRALVNREGAIAKLSYETKKFYCNRRNMTRDRMTDGSCGPTNGNNCHACRQLDIQARDRYADIVNKWYSKPPPVPSSVVYRK